MKRTFRLHWKGGKTEDISIEWKKDSADACSQAMNQAGIGRGALAALDYWEEITGKEQKGLTTDAE